MCSQIESLVYLVLPELVYNVEIIKFTWSLNFKIKYSRNFTLLSLIWVILTCFSEFNKYYVWWRNQFEFYISVYLTVSSLWHTVIKWNACGLQLNLYIFFRNQIVLMDFKITCCCTPCWFDKHGNLLISHVPIFYWVVNPFIKQNTA